MQAKLVVVGEEKPRQFELRLPAVIGRSRSTDVTLGHALISRRHCEVFEADGLLMLRDLGSLNGTFVGEKRLAQDAMPLEPGDRFTVGPVTLQAEYRRPEGSAPENGHTLDAPMSDVRLAEPDDASDDERGPRG